MTDEPPTSLVAYGDDTEAIHHVTAMTAAGGLMAIACRCGLIFSAAGMRATIKAYDQHMIRVRHDRRGDQT